ncbi:dihydrofolate reductase family protein [Actinospica durhamensis]|uniref:Riboflavin biosynthesis protein RibD n=1 Tax=Actinospica durhamensis TaxID=1508375 RepID=A0A941EIT0_9ACTN|nr:dihydrofolate reductase family protein [Actinospica durhamensis]MBR7832011.1 dihydrofolate reductase family protein [Actinospica durhamensis]
MHVLLSFAASLDGCLDDTTPERLLLSNPEDFDRVDAARAACDAILVGAGTVRADDPRLLVRSAERRAERVALGLAPSPLRVVLTGAGGIDPEAKVLTTPGAETLLIEGRPDLRAVLAELERRGVRRLMVEGGSAVLSAFLAEDLADEIQYAAAPFLIGDAAAPRAFGRPGAVLFPQSPDRRMILAESRALGDVQYTRYLVRRGHSDEELLRLTIELSRSCPPVLKAYSVGAIIAAPDGSVLSTGYSREPRYGLGDPSANHAEEVAIAKLGYEDPRLRTATLYTSLEPCSPRASRPRSCTDHILAAGIPRVVLGWREPTLLAVCDGVERLSAAGVEVLEPAGFAAAVAEVNRAVLSQD